MIPLKEDDTYLVLNGEGFVVEGAEGFYRHDTRFLSGYRLLFSPELALLQTRSPRPDHLIQDWARFRGPDGEVYLKRILQVARGKVLERLAFTNLTSEVQELEVRLVAQGNFVDLFQARGWHVHGDARAGLSFRAADGVEQRVVIHPPSILQGLRLQVSPKDTRRWSSR